MKKYLSLIFLYNRGSYKKLLLSAGTIPVCFGAILLLRTGNPFEADAYMLMERAFGGIWSVLLFIAVILIGLLSAANSLNGKKAAKGTLSTTGYTVRRLCISPVSAYITLFFYYLALIIIFWGVAVASLFIIGKAGLVMAGAAGIDTKLALGLLRTEIGHALIPIAHPAVIVFNIAAALALAGECARSCYLSWHNGTPSAGVALVIIPMILVWIYNPDNSYILLAILIVFIYAGLSLGDVIFREKRPKGDPFKVNSHDGIVDLDSTEFDDTVHFKVNSPTDLCSLSNPESQEISMLSRYGRDEGKSLRLRRRFLPLGINLEKTDFLWGACIFLGIAEHLLFFGKFLLKMRAIESSIKGITIDSGTQMPYFWELQEHTYYGYILGILLVLIVQTYWNYAYYNKETKSVYVMKRLPDRKEYSRTIWVTPVIEAVFIAVIMVVHTMLDLCLYAFVTPDIALYPDYLSHILPF